jgi:hypothetical protein
MKAIIGIILVIVLAIAGYFGWTYYTIQQAATGPAREIVSESLSKSGDTWHVSFMSKFDAPVDKVYEAFTHPERVKEFSDSVIKSELVTEEGNTKTVDVVGRLEILPPGFKVQDLRTEWQFFPSEHRMTSKSIDFKLADIVAEYKFEPTPDGKGTLLKLTQTNKDKGAMPVESLQKGAIREAYLLQIRAAEKALGLGGDTKKQAG